MIRPGHAELNFFYKYGEHGDWCGAGRASGRETVGRVAGGAVAKQILARERHRGAGPRDRSRTASTAAASPQAR